MIVCILLILINFGFRITKEKKSFSSSTLFEKIKVSGKLSSRLNKMKRKETLCSICVNKPGIGNVIFRNFVFTIIFIRDVNRYFVTSRAFSHGGNMGPHSVSQKTIVNIIGESQYDFGEDWFAGVGARS